MLIHGSRPVTGDNRPTAAAGGSGTHRKSASAAYCSPKSHRQEEAARLLAATRAVNPHLVAIAQFAALAPAEEIRKLIGEIWPGKRRRALAAQPDLLPSGDRHSPRAYPQPEEGIRNQHQPPSERVGRKLVRPVWHRGTLIAAASRPRKTPPLQCHNPHLDRAPEFLRRHSLKHLPRMFAASLPRQAFQRYAARTTGPS
nr:unnamed protein product [Digitaria exilis]